MKVEVKVPSFGESVSEATVVNILKSSGSYVNKDEEILELETEKVNSPVIAPESGNLTLSVNVEDSVKIGQVIGHIETDAKPLEKAAPKAETPKKIEPEVKESAPTTSAKISTDEFVKSLDEKAPPQPVERQVLQEESASGNRKKMSGLRKTIAKRLVQVKNQTAMLTTFNEVDMSKIMQIRTDEKDKFQKNHKVKLGFMSFFVKAATSALQKFPDVNAYIEGDDIVYFDNCNIGIAVSTDKGLMVPVVRSCEDLSFADIELAIQSFADRAREGKLSMQDLQGGGFTITNGGVFGSLLSTPILNPPQSAILGMHSIKQRPIAVNGKVEIRPMMYLALSYDHRTIDGKESVQFLVHMKELLEDPTRLLLDF